MIDVNGYDLTSHSNARTGNYLLLGVTSSPLAFPVYEPESLPDERSAWLALRDAHPNEIRHALVALRPAQRVLLFCHDPTALLFLRRDETVRRSLAQIEQTVIGHLHSAFYFQQSSLLTGMPTIRFLGNSIRRMTQALSDARCWRDFKVRLCPSMAGIELRKDGEFYEAKIDEAASRPAQFLFHALPR